MFVRSSRTPTTTMINEINEINMKILKCEHEWSIGYVLLPATTFGNSVRLGYLQYASELQQCFKCKKCGHSEIRK